MRNTGARGSEPDRDIESALSPSRDLSFEPWEIARPVYLAIQVEPFVCTVWPSVRDHRRSVVLGMAGSLLAHSRGMVPLSFFGNQPKRARAARAAYRPQPYSGYLPEIGHPQEGSSYPLFFQ